MPNSLRLALPGTWTWMDLNSESFDDALARLPEQINVDVVDFAVRCLVAYENGAALVGVCSDLDGASVDMQVELSRADVLAREDGLEREAIEAAAWAFRFYFGRDPQLEDLFDGPGGLPTLRFEATHLGFVRYICVAPDNSPPMIVTFRSFDEEAQSELRQIGDTILLTSAWSAEDVRSTD